MIWVEKFASKTKVRSKPNLKFKKIKSSSGWSTFKNAVITSIVVFFQKQWRKVINAHQFKLCHPWQNDPESVRHDVCPNTADPWSILDTLALLSHWRTHGSFIYSSPENNQTLSDTKWYGVPIWDYFLFWPVNKGLEGIN